jgi:adenylosuccinate synthase
VVDWLVRTEGAKTVVRWNGGAQAGHHVVTPDGRRHTFAQFGAGSFVEGVQTHLAAPFVLHPGALGVEAGYLARAGVPDALERLTVDERALVSTPFHQAAGRLRELERGADRHGSCGVGVGEAVGDALAAHADTIRVADLRRPELLAKLRAQQERKRAEVAGDGPDRALLDDPRAPERIVEAWAPVTSRLRVVEGFGETLRDGVTVFEGAQGVLLDQDWGFHPHTTWSDCTPAAAERLLADHGFDGESVRVGVIRAYATRHGAGPFPTEDPGWTARLPDSHNVTDAWQGAFRCGPLDLVLLRYALRVTGGVDRLAVTCLDRLAALPAPSVCTAYESGDLDPGAPGDLFWREGLGRHLRTVRPLLRPVRDADDLLDHLRASGAAPWLLSYGPAATDKRLA